MTLTTRRQVLAIIGIFTLGGFLAACDRQEQSVAALKPVPIHDGEECHICGMTINNFPGPKGEVYIHGSDHALKFCSTRDLFAYLTQPEAKSLVRDIYVHDMAATTWKAPIVDAFVKARPSWYVIDHPLIGAMGPTLASFKDKVAAEDFIQQHGGRILRFDQIDANLISNLR